jgi:hypothetical protein
MSAEIPWDAPSRYGIAGRAAKRVLQRVLRPALIRQSAVNASLEAGLAAQERKLEQMQAASRSAASPWLAQLGELQYRVDELERQRELDPARALVDRAPRPSAGERILAVGHAWHPEEERRVVCSGAKGPHASLLSVSAVTLEAYARRHRWDLVLSGEDLARGRSPHWSKLELVRDLLKQYDVVAWIDADALFVDLEHDLADELDPDKDFYLVPQEGGVPTEQVLNSGVFMLRAGDWSERLLDEIWAHDRSNARHWFENAAVMRVLGYDIDASRLRHGGFSPWLERVKLIDLAWNSIPHWSRSPHPRINHWGGLPLAHRRVLMLDDLTRTMVARCPSDPVAEVGSRRDLPAMFNRLGLLGVGVMAGSPAADETAWILHRWLGSRLISVDPSANGSVHRLAPFGSRSEVWPMAGDEAVRHAGERSLDFVCLSAWPDGAITAEITRWASKLRPGAVMSGTGYFAGVGADGRPGVRSAVERFWVERGLEVHETEADRPWPSWWVSIPPG